MRSRKLAACTIGIALASSGVAVAAAPVAAAAPVPEAAAVPEPVIIVPGMIGMGPIVSSSYIPMQLKFTSKGYDATIFSTPDFGLTDIPPNAQRLNDLVNKTLARTGAKKVKLVAHSQGGLVARHYIKNLGGDQKVTSLTMLATTNNGTALANLANFFGAGALGLKGIQKQAIGSDYLKELNSGDQSVGDVKYTSIATRYDEVAVPYTTAFMRASDGNIENITLQDQCPLRFPEHLAIVVNGAVLDGVLDSLRGERVKMNCWAIV